jgi:hypothetical protein
MKAESAYLIAIRIDPDAEVAEWFTTWFELESGENRVGSRGGRVVWMRDPADVRQNAGSLIPGGYVLEPDAPAVADIAGALHSIQSGEAGNEAEVLDSLNLLDDILITTGSIADLPNRRSLDVLVGHLTEGEPIARATKLAGGERLILETIISALGRLFVWSTFDC